MSIQPSLPTFPAIKPFAGNFNGGCLVRLSTRPGPQAWAVAVLVSIALCCLCGCWIDRRNVDGVPLPADISVSHPAQNNSFAGAWSGLWGNRLKHILVVESVQPDGTADVVYAYGDMISWGINKGFERYPARIDGDQLVVSGRWFVATYQKLPSGVLMANFKAGPTLSQAILHPLNLGSRQPKWTAAEFDRIKTELSENGQAIELEVVTFKPAGAGPFPLAIVNHGSTGNGKIPAIAKLTFVDTAIAQFLTDRGYLVVFPQRRGRGKSDGLYDEGFRDNRENGYSCSTRKSLAGADRALTDLEQIIKTLVNRPDVEAGPILLSGVSRGGILSMAYAGRHPDQVSGVINFVGGWMSEGCRNGAEINDTLFIQAAKFPRKTLSLYGENDTYYSTAHTTERFQTFKKHGGQGVYEVFDVPGGNGHSLSAAYDLWSPVAAAYLNAMQSQ